MLAPRFGGTSAWEMKNLVVFYILARPNWLLRIVALVDKSVGQIVAERSKREDATNATARRVPGWSLRSVEDAVAGTCESLVRLGLLRYAKRD